jgi:hypothetical protein
VVVVVLIGAFAAWKLFGGATSHKVTGSLTLMSPSNSRMISFDGRNCAGGDGFTDITPGAQVLVMNGAGRVIARSSGLSAGLQLDGDCFFTFGVTVPPANLYRFEVGDAGRWFVTYSQSDLARVGYRVRMRVGSEIGL